MRAAQLATTFAVAAFFAGCFPYLQTWRPALRGTVVDNASHPVASVRVETCTASHWEDSTTTCKRPGHAEADADGRFALEKSSAWDWCCLGEAPRPETLVIACGAGGDVFLTRTRTLADSEDVVLRLVLPTDTEASADVAFARQVCSR
jgi:hypothetical protein